MFTESDYEKLHQIMAESPEKEELLTKLLHSHRMDISTISHEIRNPLTLIQYLTDDRSIQSGSSEYPALVRLT